MAYFKGGVTNNLKSNSVNKRPMTIIKKEDMDKEFEEKIIDYCTFYRRNVHRFVEHYFGIKLHLYQIIMIYLMNLCPQVVLLCARSISKSFITALYSCAVAVLYPGSKVVITAKLMKTSRLIVSEKIQKELMVMSPNLAREIQDIKTSTNNTEVIFRNSSSVIVTACTDNARGLRSTILIVDEFRQCDKGILDSVFSPMGILRPTPYTMKKEYSHLGEDPREIYLSSAYYKSSWLWDMVKSSTLNMYDGMKSLVFATDYALSIKHSLRSFSQMEKEKRKFDPITYEQEYLNICSGSTSDAFYTYDLISQAQKIKRPWYPRKAEEYADKKRTWFGDIKPQSEEFRVVSMDIAISASTKKVGNDLSVIKCIRVLPNGEKYERQEVYIETMEGVDIDSQAIRVRQIMEDFGKDCPVWLVFDARTYGTNLVDSMAKVLYDPIRDVEYNPIKCFNVEALSERCKNPNASPIMWGFIGSAQSNHDMHVSMLGALSDKKYKMLISSVNCKEEYLSDKKEYKNATPEDKAQYELPFVHSDLTLNEMINLSKEYIQGGKIRLVEPSNGLKDKYITSAMANLFIQELETKLTKKQNKVDISSLLQFSSQEVKRRRLF